MTPAVLSSFFKDSLIHALIHGRIPKWLSTCEEIIYVVSYIIHIYVYGIYGKAVLDLLRSFLPLLLCTSKMASIYLLPIYAPQSYRDAIGDLFYLFCRLMFKEIQRKKRTPDSREKKHLKSGRNKVFLMIPPVAL